MGNLTTSKFVAFLKQCGPWEDNESQFEEYVLKNAQSRNIKPLEYNSGYDKDLANIKQILDTGRSKIVLISGRAGDGKTHFLGKLFESPELFNLPTERWQEVLNTNSSLLTIPNVKGFKLTVVSDLTQVPEDSDAEQVLYKDLLEILQDCQVSSGASQEPRLLVIAGNTGQTLKKLNLLSKGLENPEKYGTEQPSGEFTLGSITGTKQQYNEWLALVDDLLRKLKVAFVENGIFSHDAVTVIDMSNRINDQLIKEIFDVILGNPYWEPCRECSCYSVCPIQRNIELLKQPWLQQRIQRLLFLLKSDGAHLTIRNVQALVINALLGQGFESRFDNSYLSCRKIANKIEDGHCTLKSNVYDNLLGLNFKPNQRDDQRLIFELMSSLNLGANASKNLDEFLLQDSNNELRSKFLERFDIFGLEDQLQTAWDNLKKANLEAFESSQGSNLASAQQQFTKSLQALHRLVFFNVGAPLDAQQQIGSEIDYDHSVDLFTDPYAMTKYHYARDYVQLIELAKENRFEEIRSNPAANKLILALNRLFTGLLTFNDNSEVFITASNILNLNILYEPKIFKFTAYNYGSARSINLKFIPDTPSVPVLQFIDEAKLGAEETERKTAELVLSPKVFECLMQLAHGTTSSSLPNIDIQELIIFKARIFAILEPYTSSLFSNAKVTKLMASISRLEVESGGNIVLRQRINNRT